MKNIFWLAGEKSGDLHASIVLQEIKQAGNKYNHSGVGGPLMQKYGLKPVFPFERFAVMGFVEVFKHLSFFLEVEKKISEIFRKSPPDLVVLVDYPGLNMRIAKLAKKSNIPVLYYISPQFWAWKFKRIYKLKRYTSQLAYILPFEEKYFKQHQVNAAYVGHPIAQEIEVKLSKSEFAGKHQLDLNKKWIGFLPGSRDTELKKLLPVYLETAVKLDLKKYQFILSQANSVSAHLFDSIVRKSGLSNYKIIHEDNYELMKHSDFLVVTSGTATLETAYLGTPFLIAYKTSRLSYELGKRFVKINRIGLPNIVIDKDIVPELIQSEVTPRNLMKKIEDILYSEEKYKQIENDLKELHNILGSLKTSQEMKRLIEEMLHE